MQEGPIRSFLKSYKPILPRPKFFKQEEEDEEEEYVGMSMQRRMLYQAFGIPPDVSTEEAIDIVAGTPWAQEAGAGIARRLGLVEGTDEYNRVKNAWARALAEGMIRRTPRIEIPPAPTTPRGRRGR